MFVSWLATLLMLPALVKLLENRMFKNVKIIQSGGEK
jgi:hypothetical protein